MPDPRNERLWETFTGCLFQFGTPLMGALIAGAAGMWFLLKGCQ